jgi:hypothetical protein
MSRTPLWNSYGGYGDGPVTLALPVPLADRYKATARAQRGRPNVLIAVTVSDRMTGATFDWRAHDNRVTLKLAGDATRDSRDLLWRDGSDIIGLAHKQTGGALSGTGTAVDRLVDLMIEWRSPAGDWPTVEFLAEKAQLSDRQVRRIGGKIPGSAKPYDKLSALAQVRLGAIASG